MANIVPGDIWRHAKFIDGVWEVVGVGTNITINRLWSGMEETRIVPIPFFLENYELQTREHKLGTPWENIPLKTTGRNYSTKPEKSDRFLEELQKYIDWLRRTDREISSTSVADGIQYILEEKGG